MNNKVQKIVYDEKSQVEIARRELKKVIKELEEKQGIMIHSVHVQRNDDCSFASIRLAYIQKNKE